MNALEIKPGKYRTVDGKVATIASVNGRIAEGTKGDGPFNAYCWSLDDNGCNPHLIERIEDEPKAEDGSRMTIATRA